MQLDKKLEDTFRLQLPQKKALERLGLRTIRDLLYHFPNRYISTDEIKTIKSLKKGDSVIVFGKITKLKTSKGWHSKIPMASGTLEDETGKIKVVWFHQPYIAKTFKDDSLVKVTGKVGENKAGAYFSNPEIKYVSSDEIQSVQSLFNNARGTAEYFSVYPESRGITSRWFTHAIAKILNDEEFEKVQDTLPDTLLKKYNLPNLVTALRWIHAPVRQANTVAAQKRFSFEEIFYIQLSRQKMRAKIGEQSAFPITIDKEKINDFLNTFPFALTSAQKKVMKQIYEDIKNPHPMARLLEGDVGSGKTAVAAAAVFATSHTRPPGQDFGNLNTAYMAPTEILARQHFESFIEFFKGSGIQIGLITGSECRKFPSKVDSGAHTKISRAQLLKWVENGEIPVIVGTHALIQKSIKFKNLGLVIIDEQHRFGVAQRAELAQKKTGERTPHLLSMTATPIPRTLALTIYGDLDLSLIDEMPAGRKQIITEIVTPSARKSVYEKIRAELRQGRQAYVICPRINEPDPEKANALRLTSAKTEAARLQKEIFPEYKVSLVHSKLKKEEKEEVMKSFADGKSQILTATSVVEVGVNVPEATSIIIEGSERFGLAQLHQLRGRVLRSTHQAYCYLFTDSKSATGKERLKILKDAKNGFELAEKDLQIRGEGSLTGTKQWGISDLGMEAIKNLKMVEAARTESQNILKTDPALNKHPLIKEGLLKRENNIHFE